MFQVILVKNERPGQCTVGYLVRDPSLQALSGLITEPGTCNTVPLPDVLCFLSFSKISSNFM